MPVRRSWWTTTPPAFPKTAPSSGSGPPTMSGTSGPRTSGCLRSPSCSARHVNKRRRHDGCGRLTGGRAGVAVPHAHGQAGLTAGVLEAVIPSPNPEVDATVAVQAVVIVELRAANATLAAVNQ